MAVNAHRGTAGHTIGMDIIGKDNPPGTAKQAQGIDPTTGKLKHINVEFADNGGVSVQHRVAPSGKNKDEYDPRLEQTHMFRDASEAHGHIGALMGLRMASGSVKN